MQQTGHDNDKSGKRRKAKMAKKAKRTPIHPCFTEAKWKLCNNFCSSCCKIEVNRPDKRYFRSFGFNFAYFIPIISCKRMICYKEYVVTTQQKIWFHSGLFYRTLQCFTHHTTEDVWTQSEPHGVCLRCPLHVWSTDLPPQLSPDVALRLRPRRRYGRRQTVNPLQMLADFRSCEGACRRTSETRHYLSLVTLAW